MDHVKQRAIALHPSAIVLDRRRGAWWRWWWLRVWRWCVCGIVCALPSARRVAAVVVAVVVAAAAACVVVACVRMWQRLRSTDGDVCGGGGGGGVCGGGACVCVRVCVCIVMPHS